MAILLVPTDYSAASANAARYAAQLAQKINAEVHLLHIYQFPVGYTGLGMQPFDATFAPMPMMEIPFEELKTAAESGMTRFAEALATEYPGVTFKQQVQPGAHITGDINEYATTLHPFLIIIGAHDLHGIENWDNHVVPLVKGLRYPVVAVPEHYTSRSITNAILATDLQPLLPQQAAAITAVLQQAGASLTVVHVSSNEKDLNNIESEMQTLFSGLRPTFATIVNDDVTEGLQSHLQSTVAELLIILPHHHNLWERLFSKENTSGILSSISIPILALPESK